MPKGSLVYPYRPTTVFTVRSFLLSSFRYAFFKSMTENKDLQLGMQIFLLSWVKDNNCFQYEST